MSTLLALYNSARCVGRCDANCYNATEPKCTCICGGVNHGVGYPQARENTQAAAKRWLDNYTATHGADKITFAEALGEPLTNRQGTLFPKV